MEVEGLARDTRVSDFAGENPQYQEIGGLKDRYCAIPGFVTTGYMVSHHCPQFLYRYAEGFRSFGLGILGLRRFQRRYMRSA